MLKMIDCVVLCLLLSCPAFAASIGSLMAQAEAGDAKAQCAVGEMYINGNGVEKNLDKAEAWLLKAAEQDNLRAQLLLGQLYYDPQSSKYDKSMRFIWLGTAITHPEFEKLSKNVQESIVMLTMMAHAQLSDAEAELAHKILEEKSR